MRWLPASSVRLWSVLESYLELLIEGVQPIDHSYFGTVSVFVSHVRNKTEIKQFSQKSAEIK